MKLSNVLVFVVVVATTLGTSVHAQSPGPVMDYTSLLNSLDVHHGSGRLELGLDHKIMGAFLEDGATVDAVLTLAGSDEPLHVQEFYVQKWYGSFFEVSSRGKYVEYVFPEAGDYVMTYRANGVAMTSLPFSVVVNQGGDDFNPITHYYMNGPWNDWAQIALPLDSPERKSPQLVMWRRKMSFVEGADSNIYHTEIRLNGDVVADCGDSYVASHEWQRVQEDFRYPENKGGYPMKQQELMATDGTYDVVVTLDGQLDAVYQFEIQDGKPVNHERQASNWQPRTEYMIPRFAGEDTQAELAANVVWMQKLPETEARRVYEGGAAAVSGPSEEQLDRWVWEPSVDPGRPFSLVMTEIETRDDTTIRVGDELVVFGTGYPAGVHYIKVGDSEPREIPHGETFDSMVFQVCGRKIVLVKRNQLFVFDTDSETMTEIPLSEINLYDARGGIHRANLLNADGNLAVVVNKVVDVQDKIAIKVIDLSGDQPVIIPIKNGPYVDRDVSSVAVDAGQGMVAISSRQQDSLYVAPVVPLADQTVFELGDYKGMGDEQVFIVDDGIVYADGEDMVRHMKLDGSAPMAIIDEPFGRSGNGFTVNRDMVVVSTSEKYGTRFEMAVSELPSKPALVQGTGESIEGTSGALGMAGCATITHDRTVFLAGTPSGGIGVGEHLQVLHRDGGEWLPVVDAQGQVISAIDVVSSVGLLAFKTGGRGKKTTIGYVTFGQRIDLAQVPVQGGSPSVTMTDSDSGTVTSGNGISNDSSEESPYYTQNQLELDLIVGYVTAEQEIITALTEAFGEAEARKKAREGTLTAIRNNGHEHLIEGFLKMADED
ncbi:MAG: hypothetical protein AAF456_07295 [Planctomycetota bacterium]